MTWVSGDHDSLGESSVFMTKSAITGMSNHCTSIIEKLDLESFLDNQDIFALLFTPYISVLLSVNQFFR